MNRVAEPQEPFGGPWTIEKLRILENYLDAYTTALKNQSFRLMYIDAFAGTGQITLADGDIDNDGVGFLRGSAERAIGVDDKPFDRLIFVEKDPERCGDLERLKEENSDKEVTIENSDANDFLRSFSEDWKRWRGVLFLDPFATEVAWATIEAVARFEALDTWILFPTSAIARMLPLSREPDDISNDWNRRLDRVFGGDHWRVLYHPNPQSDLFQGPNQQRDSGVEGLIRIYKENLKNLYGQRFLPESRTLYNSRNVPLFEFLFCVGHPRGIGPAKKIAKHILDHM